MDMLSDEGDLYSDEDESQYIQSGSNVDGVGGGSGSSDSGFRSDRNIPSAADRRAHHNALERKRRDHIKDSFSSLRDSVPSLHGEKASRAQILKKAAEYIQFMRKKNTSIVSDIETIKEQNRLLEEQIQNYEKRLAMSPTRSSASSTPTQTLLSPNNNNSNSLYSTGVQSLLTIGAAAASESSVNGVTSPTISYGDISENSNESNVTSNSDLNMSLNGGNGRLTDSPILSQTSSAATPTTVVTMNPTTAIVQRQSTGRQLATQPLTTQQAQLLINGSSAGATVRSVVKNGSSTIIVQNPQIKSNSNGPHVIHVPANNNCSNAATATPIIISTTSLTNANGTNNSLAANGNTTYRVLNAKASGGNSPTISFAPATATTAAANGAYRTVLVQPSTTLTTQQSSSGTTTPNIHIVSTIPAYSGRVVGTSTGTTKRFKISATTAPSAESNIEINNNNNSNNKKSNTSSSLNNATSTIIKSSTNSGSTNASNNSKTFNITSVSS